MSISKGITAKKQLYKAMWELECWADDEERWRYVAIMDYDAAITALRAVLVEAEGPNFADGWCGAIDEMAKERYHFDDTDIATAKLVGHSFLQGHDD